MPQKDVHDALTYPSGGSNRSNAFESSDMNTHAVEHSSERSVAQDVAGVFGRLAEFWGFRRSLGQVWGILYLSPAPLDAAAIAARAGLSTSAVSLTLSELHHWGAIRKRRVIGSRRDHWLAETRVWRLVASVVQRREMRMLQESVEALEAALGRAKAERNAAAPECAEEADAMVARIATLLRLVRGLEVFAGATLAGGAMRLKELFSPQSQEML